MDGFIVVGNGNAVTYKEVFPLIKDGKVRLGYRSLGSEFYFDITDDYKTHIVKEKKEGSGWKEINGIICGRVANACWFTNLPVSKKPLILTKTYDPEKYPKYDNYDAINVDRVKDIPCDYDGVIGVPITILNYDLNDVEVVGAYNYSKDYDGHTWNAKINNEYVYKRVLIKKNFEIVGWSRHNDENMDGGYWEGGKNDATINGVDVYRRILIRFVIVGLMSGAKGDGLTNGNDGRVKFYVDGKPTYARVLIRRKEQ